MQCLLYISLKWGYAMGIQGKREVAIMDTIAQIISIVGCLNWGLIGIFQFDLVAWLFGGQGSLFSRIVYTLVGLAGDRKSVV